MDDQSDPGTLASERTSEPEAEPGQSAPAAKAKKKKNFWRELLTIVVAAAVLTLLVKAFIVQVYRIPSASMENTLQVGDRVLVNKVVYHFRGIARGDIIVFSGQDSWGPDAPPPSSDPVVRIFDDVLSGIGLQNNQTYYIKRVIGLPGDHVACCTDGQVTVNRVPLSEGSYLYPGNPPSLYQVQRGGSGWPPVGHGGPPQRLRGFALSNGLSGRRCDTREPGRRPRVPDHLAAVADPGSAHPVDLRPGRAARGRGGRGRARRQRGRGHGRRGRAERRGGRPGGGSGRRRRCHRSSPAPAAPPSP